MSFFDPSLEPMLEMFLFETNTLLDSLDEIMLESEKQQELDELAINEIFRIMHTIKGSSAMMGLTEISSLAHRTEDMFFIIRENPAIIGSNSSAVFDCVFVTLDFFKQEVELIQADSNAYAPTDSSAIVGQIEKQIEYLNSGGAPEAESPAVSTVAPEQANSAPVTSDDANSAQDTEFRIKVYFEEDCQMENIRAFMLLNSLKDICDTLDSVPKNPEANSDATEEIIQKGLLIIFTCADGPEPVYEAIESAVNIRSYEVVSDSGNLIIDHSEEPEVAPVTPVAQAPEVTNPSEEEKPAEPKAAPSAVPAPTPTPVPVATKPDTAPKPVAKPTEGAVKQNLISVNQTKLDQLMDLVGEIVIAEAMVASNVDLKGLSLDNFSKATRQLRKLTDELQDVVMSIRMVPLNGLYQKMNRIVRDMGKKLEKDVELVTMGGDTEIDKTIIDSITDPFMHMIRNCMDHGLEDAAARLAAGKPAKGKLTLSAQNIGGEIVINISDDGKGLNPEVLLAKAKKNGILTRPENEYTTKEIYNFIMLPGFSTNEQVTEFSGRGVGMDVVRQNIEKCSGSVTVESELGVGTTFVIKIPLTLAIVDGMDLRVGSSTFTLPIVSIKQSFKVTEESQLFTDIDGNEMIMLRGDCYPILRLHEHFNFQSTNTELTDGILVLAESNGKRICIFADELLGEQQVVVKPFPSYLNRYNIKDCGLAGCSILGDGGISLILDISKLVFNHE